MREGGRERGKKQEQNKTTTDEIIETTFCYCRLPIQRLTMDTQFMWSFEDSSGFYTCSTGVGGRVCPPAIIVRFIVFLHANGPQCFTMQITQQRVGVFFFILFFFLSVQMCTCNIIHLRQ